MNLSVPRSSICESPAIMVAIYFLFQSLSKRRVRVDRIERVFDASFLYQRVDLTDPVFKCALGTKASVQKLIRRNPIVAKILHAERDGFDADRTLRHPPHPLRDIAYPVIPIAYIMQTGEIML